MGIIRCCFKALSKRAAKDSEVITYRLDKYLLLARIALMRMDTVMVHQSGPRPYSERAASVGRRKVAAPALPIAGD